MTALTYTLGVVLFAFGVAFSIALHEMGHLIPGKLFNVKVTQYFVGFGRTLWSTMRGETEYGLKAIPLGGYCKLVGMVPPDPGRTRTSVRAARPACSPSWSATRRPRSTSTSTEDHDRLFYNKPWWQRVIIMGSGVAINLVLAFVLFAIAFMVIGVDKPTTTVGGVSQCVVAVSKANVSSRPSLPRDRPRAPAKAAGFLPGDRFVSFNGKRITDWARSSARSGPTATSGRPSSWSATAAG